ncbi:MAG: NAD-dependent DNA ligase LigA [Clostridia bacterium]
MAILSPVRIAGSIISKTTLHNFDYIELKDIRIDDTVLVQKAGDVIPEVVEVLKDKRDGTKKEYIRPTICPVCKEPLEVEEDIVALRCTNSECPALRYRSITHFASRECMDISGMGESIVEQLIDADLLKDVADIYYLKYNDIISLSRFAPKSASNLINAINETKSNTIDKLIFGMGIRHIGKKAAKRLAESFENIGELQRADVDTLNLLDDFGEIMAKSVVEFFNKEKTLEIISKLELAGVNLKGNKKEYKTKKLIDKTFVVTGTFEGISRNDIVKIIEDNAGKFSSSVSKKTSYIIAGSDAGSKLKKAEELGVEVIDVNRLQDMVKSSDGYIKDSK